MTAAELREMADAMPPDDDEGVWLMLGPDAARLLADAADLVAENDHLQNCRAWLARFAAFGDTP